MIQMEVSLRQINANESNSVQTSLAPGNYSVRAFSSPGFFPELPQTRLGQIGFNLANDNQLVEIPVGPFYSAITINLENGEFEIRIELDSSFTFDKQFGKPLEGGPESIDNTLNKVRSWKRDWAGWVQVSRILIRVFDNSSDSEPVKVYDFTIPLELKNLILKSEMDAENLPEDFQFTLI